MGVSARGVKFPSGLVRFILAVSSTHKHVPQQARSHFVSTRQAKIVISSWIASGTDLDPDSSRNFHPSRQHAITLHPAASSTPAIGQRQGPALRLGAGAALAGAALDDFVAEFDGTIFVWQRDPLGRLG